ncbi:hypothetical protein [Crocinitomix algicola]|uniref:hypothetical protein n=1 Tax=Crocinitomix algicola TaxID=1740263 RepID=UPI00083478F4|nr:hypothetical protein [Crocinitomix algicola]
MIREVKISVGIFLIFLFYAITSFFKLGAFLAPFFFNELILFLVAVAFAIINRKEKGSGIVFLAVLTFALKALADEFTVGFLVDRLDLQLLNNFANEPWFLFSGAFVFYGFIITMLIFLIKSLKYKWVGMILLVLLVLNVSLGFTTEPLLADIFLNLFFILFFISVSRLTSKNQHTLVVVSALFLLHFLLDIFKYFFI